MIKSQELSDPSSCMNKAKDDEMTFVLLARDEAAPDTILFWVNKRIELGKNAPGDLQIQEAIACASIMEDVRKGLQKSETAGLPVSQDNDIWAGLDAMEAKEFAEPHEVHETGAKRGTDTNGLRYDLLSPIVTMSRAGIMAEGAFKYGDNNYLKGFKISGLYCHLMHHLMMFMLGDKTEDHLRHAQWNLDAMIHFMATMPEMDDRHPYNLTPEQIEAIKKQFMYTPPAK